MSLLDRLRNQFVCGWNIGIYRGSAPFDLAEIENNPALTAKSIASRKVDYIADPFLVQTSSGFYMFFELVDAFSGKGKIAVAGSEEGADWDFIGEVLEESFHLSFPFVFQYEGEWYMIPESAADRSIRLYRAENFPRDWRFEEKLLEGGSFKDSSVVKKDNNWFLWSYEEGDLRLYYSPTLISGNWREHPQSPVDEGRYARPGGSIFEYDNRLFRFIQDSYPVYGSKLLVNEISKLSPGEYEEKEHIANFIEPGGAGWKNERVHHIDLVENNRGEWLAAVDGFSSRPDLRPTVIFRRFWRKLFQTNQ